MHCANNTYFFQLSYTYNNSLLFKYKYAAVTILIAIIISTIGINIDLYKSIGSHEN